MRARIRLKLHLLGNNPTRAVVFGISSLAVDATNSSVEIAPCTFVVAGETMQ
jgi:hypothetical protein